MKKYDYLIVGAGLYGAVMAYDLSLIQAVLAKGITGDFNSGSSRYLRRTRKVDVITYTHRHKI